MSRVSYPKSSPYAATPQSSRFIGRYVHRSIRPNSEDRLMDIQPRHEFKPEAMSQELYGTPEYWWVFMARNLKVIRDPIWDHKVGLTIVVPSANYLKTLRG